MIAKSKNPNVRIWISITDLFELAYLILFSISTCEIVWEIL